MKINKQKSIVTIFEELYKTARAAKKYRKSLHGESFYAKKFFDLRKEGTLMLRTLIQRVSNLKDPKLIKVSKNINRLAEICFDYESSLIDKNKALHDLKFIYQTDIEPYLKGDYEVVVSDNLFPKNLLKRTKPYLEKISEQARGCYDLGWFDACTVMIRKLVENLIIEAYETHGSAAIQEIKDSNDDFFSLNGLINKFLASNKWNPSRNTKRILPKLKTLGDLSAHNRFYLAKKPDIDKVRDGLRVAIEELVSIAKLK